jgi:aerobic carbon-monoxide dehydrogenase medium subunit
VSFEYHEPTSLAEAVALGARFGDEARWLAGGTDLMIQMRRGKVAPRHVVSLHRLPGLGTIEANGEVTLGAGVTHRSLERSPHFQRELRGLVEGAEVVGGLQIRNVGTVGGNIVNASPAADVVPVLLALDARVTCLGADGARTLALDDFLLGPGQTARRPDELLTAVRFAGPAPRSATGFLKAGRRKAMEISVVCVAARLVLDESLERCADVRIALGAVGPRTFRARAAERLLDGAPATDDLFRQAGQAAAVECRPISDVRASSDYRRRLVATLVARALGRCRQRAQEAIR